MPPCLVTRAPGCRSCDAINIDLSRRVAGSRTRCHLGGNQLIQHEGGSGQIGSKPKYGIVSSIVFSWLLFSKKRFTATRDLQVSERFINLVLLRDNCVMNYCCVGQIRGLLRVGPDSALILPPAPVDEKGRRSNAMEMPHISKYSTRSWPDSSRPFRQVSSPRYRRFFDAFEYSLLIIALRLRYERSVRRRSPAG